MSPQAVSLAVEEITRAKRWKDEFVQGRMTCCEIAVRFLAEKWSNPREDIIELVYSPLRDCFTKFGSRDDVIPNAVLEKQIEEFMKVEGRPRWIEAAWVRLALKGVCLWWEETDAKKG